MPMKSNKEPTMKNSETISTVYPFTSGGFLIDALWLLSIALVYLGAVQVGLYFRLQPEGIASIWPPSGVAMAALLLSERKKWIWVVVVIVATNLSGNVIGGNTVPVSLGFALANGAECILGAWVFTLLTKQPVTFSKVQEILTLFGVALFSNGLTALLGAVVATISFGASIFDTWLVWLIADGLGILLITPFFVTWAATSQSIAKTFTARRTVEVIALILAILILFWLIRGSATKTSIPFFRIYMIFPVLIWISFRFSPRGAVTFILVLAGILLQNLLSDDVIFEWAGYETKTRILSVQILLGIVTATGVTLAASVLERKLAKEALAESEQRFRTIVNNSQAGYFFMDEKGFFRDVNQAWLTIHKLSSKEEVLGTHYKQRQVSHDMEGATEIVEKLMSGVPIPVGEFSRLNADGSIGYHTFSANPVYTKRMITGLEGFLIDSTERKRADEQIKAALKEKETLLQEIHHRTKNNMAVISSLLSLQANTIDDERSKAALIDSRHRVQSMSAIHELLYQSENISSIDLKSYLSRIIQSAFNNYSITDKIKLNIHSGKLLMPPKQASSLGLVANELITNSIKYAFPDDRKGEITVSIKEIDDKRIQLVMEDDGIGMPAEVDWRNPATLGLQLVHTLVENQLDGTIEMASHNGTRFMITFEIDKP